MDLTTGFSEQFIKYYVPYVERLIANNEDIWLGLRKIIERSSHILSSDLAQLIKIFGLPIENTNLIFLYQRVAKIDYPNEDSLSIILPEPSQSLIDMMAEEKDCYCVPSDMTSLFERYEVKPSQASIREGMKNSLQILMDGDWEIGWYQEDIEEWENLLIAEPKTHSVSSQ